MYENSFRFKSLHAFEMINLWFSFSRHKTKDVRLPFDTSGRDLIY